MFFFSIPEPVSMRNLLNIYPNGPRILPLICAASAQCGSHQEGCSPAVHRQWRMLGLRQPPARGCMSAGTQSGEECLDTESDSDQDIPPPREMTGSWTTVMPLQNLGSPALTAARITMMKVPVPMQKLQFPASAKPNAGRDLWMRASDRRPHQCNACQNCKVRAGRVCPVEPPCLEAQDGLQHERSPGLRAGPDVNRWLGGRVAERSPKFYT